MRNCVHEKILLTRREFYKFFFTDAVHIFEGGNVQVTISNGEIQYWVRDRNIMLVDDTYRFGKWFDKKYNGCGPDSMFNVKMVFYMYFFVRC